jgi:hypothetical protein
MFDLKEHRIKLIIVSIEIAVVFWAVWQNAEVIVAQLATFFGVSEQVIFNLLIAQGILILALFGALWKLIKK